MKVAICDDNAEFLREYKRVLATIIEKHDIPAEIELFQHGRELMFAMEDEENPVDLVFLDIGMPEIDGIELAHWIRKKGINCEIIFLTASQSHMLNAFDVGAFHYIVKNQTSPEKLESICMRAFDKIGKSMAEVITVSCAGETRRIPLQEIRYFEVQNYIILVHYGENAFEFYSTLGKIENTLLGKGFARTHRSYLVNLAHVRTLMRQELELSDGTRVPVGRKYAEELKKLSQNAQTQSENAVMGAMKSN